MSNNTTEFIEVSSSAMSPLTTALLSVNSIAGLLLATLAYRRLNLSQYHCCLASTSLILSIIELVMLINIGNHGGDDIPLNITEAEKLQAEEDSSLQLEFIYFLEAVSVDG